MSRVLIGRTTGRAYTVDREIGVGGQGRVLRVVDPADGAIYAAKLYHKETATREQMERIQTLVQQGSATSRVKGLFFSWPQEIVDDQDNAIFGYLMPLIDTERFSELNQIILRARPAPSILSLCRLSYLLCVGLGTVHSKGFAYCDINHKNVMFDTTGGSLFICDNDNVVVNNSDSAVLGLQDYMAPEVALGASRPNAESDLYSLAILLYQMWMWEHPMDGRQTLVGVNCWDLVSKRKYFAEQPVFVHDPGNRSNSGEGIPELQLSLERWERIVPSRLKKLFLQAFTRGIHDTGWRPRLSDWERIFLELEADAYRCQCQATNLMDPEAGTHRCYYCGCAIDAPLRLKVRYPGVNSVITVHEHTRLRRHHLETDVDSPYADQVVGTIEPHPRISGVYGLRNQSKQVWYYRHEDSVYEIQPNMARPLIPDARVTIGTAQLIVSTISG